MGTGAGNSFTRFLKDIVDDTKDFVDGLIDRAGDVEENTRDAPSGFVEDDEEGETDDRDANEAAALRKQLVELRAKIDELAECRRTRPSR